MPEMGAANDDLGGFGARLAHVINECDFVSLFDLCCFPAQGRQCRQEALPIPELDVTENLVSRHDQPSMSARCFRRERTGGSSDFEVTDCCASNGRLRRSELPRLRPWARPG